MGDMKKNGEENRSRLRRATPYSGCDEEKKVDDEVLPLELKSRLAPGSNEGREMTDKEPKNTPKKTGRETPEIRELRHRNLTKRLANGPKELLPELKPIDVKESKNEKKVERKIGSETPEIRELRHRNLTKRLAEGSKKVLRKHNNVNESENKKEAKRKIGTRETLYQRHKRGKYFEHRLRKHSNAESVNESKEQEVAPAVRKRGDNHAEPIPGINRGQSATGCPGTPSWVPTPADLTRIAEITGKPLVNIEKLATKVMDHIGQACPTELVDKFAPEFDLNGSDIMAAIAQLHEEAANEDPCKETPVRFPETRRRMTTSRSSGESVDTPPLFSCSPSLPVVTLVSSVLLCLGFCGYKLIRYLRRVRAKSAEMQPSGDDFV